MSKRRPDAMLHCQASAWVLSLKQALDMRLFISGIEKVPSGRGARSVGVGIGIASKVIVAVDDALGSLEGVSCALNHF